MLVLSLNFVAFLLYNASVIYGTLYVYITFHNGLDLTDGQAVDDRPRLAPPFL